MDPDERAPSDAYRSNLVALRRFYDGDAARRDAAGAEAWKIEGRERFLDRLRTRGARSLLEIGPGPGRDARAFADAGLAVVAVDPSEAMVAACRAKGIDARLGDVLALDRLGLAPGSFDAAYALNSLLHVPKADWGAALGAVRTRLAPGGLFLLTVYGGPSREEVRENPGTGLPRFFASWGDDELRAVAEDAFALLDFRVVEVDPEGRYHAQSLLLERPR